MMRRILTATVVLFAACSFALGQTTTQEAHEELNTGAREYRNGNFAEAQRHFERALELDPSSMNATLFIARAIQQQYRPGDMTPENLARGEEAVAAYQRILSQDPTNDDAYKAIVFLYGQMKNDDKVREMLTQRAADASLSPEKRSEAYVILASRQWQCSFDITERKENKAVAQLRGRAVVRYKMPADAADFYKAQQCVTEGLQLAEQAAALDQNTPNAWSQKVNLFREASKLAEMEGDTRRKAEYDRQYVEALRTHKRLTEELLNKREAEEAAHPSTDDASPPSQQNPEPSASDDGTLPGRRNVVISGGVLNGKAVSKPAPVYPALAKAAGAQGVVTVQIVIDEEGNVITAEAVGGHPLLQAAAVAAARQARFTPTRLQGQPVKVSGVVTYNFILR
jgi:TonB family protein